MPDSDAQSPVVAGAELREDVLQSVVPCAAAAELELHAARLQIEFVVRDQDLGRCDSIEAPQRCHREAAFVHVVLRQSESKIGSVARRSTSHQAVEAPFGFERDAELLRQPLHEPGAGIVPRARIAAPRITEANDQAQRCWHARSVQASRTKKPAGRNPAGFFARAAAYFFSSFLPPERSAPFSAPLSGAFSAPFSPAAFSAVSEAASSTGAPASASPSAAGAASGSSSTMTFGITADATTG